jgi:hypothetical protein
MFFYLDRLRSEPVLFEIVPRQTPRSVNGDRLSKRYLLVSKADRDEILEERVELVDIARRVRREVSYPLDGPLERRIGSALAMYIPPAGGLQDDEWNGRRLLARESTSARPDFLRHLSGIDLA